MRWNRLIPPYFLKCAYLSNWTGLWITPSSYLLFPPWDASPHFFCISAPFFNNLFHSFIIFIAIAIHTTFLEPADMIFHTVFHYSHGRYSKVISPMCLLASCHHVISTKYLSLAFFLEYAELWESGLTRCLLSHVTGVESRHWFHRRGWNLLKTIWLANMEVMRPLVTVFLLKQPSNLYSILFWPYTAAEQVVDPTLT